MKRRFLLAASAAVLLLACQKNNRTVPVQMVLTDNPTNLEEVNVEITGIQVKLDDDTTGWVSLETERGVYNLLALQNGLTDTIARGELPEGVLKEVRFILGANNSVKANGSTWPLRVPSGSESGLKVKIGKKLGLSLNSFVLDFDAALSVKEESDGYKLRPVIKLK